MKNLRVLFGMLLVLVATVPAFADATSTTHIYNLAGGSYADQLGGPSLVGNGGTLTANGYTFGAGQGLSLTGGANASDYSVEMVFSVNSVSNWNKLLDFKNLTSDNGLYVAAGSVRFWPTFPTTGSMGANTSTNLILTRDGGSNLVTVYLNGVSIMSFVDGWGHTLLSNNVLNFFQDDALTGGREATGGNVSLIRLYDGALSQAQVTFVDDNGGTLPSAPAPTPEPASLLLVGAGLASLAAAKRRK
jgi:hypothetical protein